MQTIVYQSIHIWFGHVMCARLFTIPVVRRVVTTIFMAILLCSLMHVTLEKSFRNQAVTRVETWKPILSLAYLSLSPINDLVSSEWVPVGFLMLGFASCSNATGLFWGFWKRSTTPCFSGPARHFVVKDRKDHILNNLNWQKDMASMVCSKCTAFINNSKCDRIKEQLSRSLVDVHRISHRGRQH